MAMCVDTLFFSPYTTRGQPPTWEVASPAGPPPPPSGRARQVRGSASQPHKRTHQPYGQRPILYLIETRSVFYVLYKHTLL